MLAQEPRLGRPGGDAAGDEFLRQRRRRLGEHGGDGGAAAHPAEIGQERRMLRRDRQMLRCERRLLRCERRMLRRDRKQPIVGGDHRRPADRFRPGVQERADILGLL